MRKLKKSQIQNINFISIIICVVACILSIGVFIGALLKPAPTVEPVIIEKVVEIEKIVEIERDPEYVYNFSASERLLLAQLVYREGRGESFETQCGIVSVVMNRLAYGYWGKTIEKVVYAKGQFTVAGSLRQTMPREENFQAVDFVARYGTTLPAYVMYFNAGGYARVPYMCVPGDNTYFSYLQKDYNKLANSQSDIHFIK